jgi:hypothetical protein
MGSAHLHEPAWSVGHRSASLMSVPIKAAQALGHFLRRSLSPVPQLSAPCNCCQSGPQWTASPGYASPWLEPPSSPPEFPRALRGLSRSSTSPEPQNRLHWSSGFRRWAWTRLHNQPQPNSSGESSHWPSVELANGWNWTLPSSTSRNTAIDELWTPGGVDQSTPTTSGRPKGTSMFAATSRLFPTLFPNHYHRRRAALSYLPRRLLF